ncbi:MAG: hypothetical protein ACI95C_000039 [Pseudohongiellaceae bacterium]|jgi:hypothetical protein
MSKFWPHLRKLLVFQFKLYLDALRDLLLSVLSLFAFFLDALLNLSGPESFFERVLAFGRRTEVTINLFNQHDDDIDPHSIDNILKDVEKRAEETLKKSKSKNR